MRKAGIVARLIALALLSAGCGTADKTNDAAAVPANLDALAAAAPAGKLPDGPRPSAYRLDLVVDPRRDGFSGAVAIDIELAAPAARIWLHGEGLDVSEVVAATAAGGEFSGSYREVLASGVSAISFDEELPAGAITVTFRYRGDFDRNLAGLFKVEEQGEAYVLAKSESIQARSYLPGFDEPGLKATFDITLTIPEEHEAIGNSPVIDRQPVGNGLQRLTFATTPPMSTYLLSLAVGPFDIVARPPIPPNEFRSRPVPLRGVARQGRGDDMNFVLDVTPRIVKIFEQELRQPYPFEKLDIVAAPQWPSGATELSAAITYREQLLLVGDNPAPGARLSLLGTHAHEIAHMWFGNLVTPPWWDDLWLKEGFATWATPLALTLLEPDGGHELNAMRRSIRAMQLDSLASTRAIREPIVDNNEIRNAYDSITYAKSLGVIHMVDHYFGPNIFRPALGRYIESFAGGVAGSPDFYEIIGEQTNTPALAETFRGFVEQTGVPVLDVALHCDAESSPALTIRQGRYKALGSPIEDDDKSWSIPVCVRSEAARQCVMMTDVRITLQLDDAGCPRWVLPNAGASGYYRWSLDDASWEALAGDFALLTPVEALSAIDSAFAAFEAGKLDETTLLKVMTASSRADAWQVVTAPFPYLQKYVRQYFTPADRERFLTVARELYQPVLDGSIDSDDPDTQLLYTDVLSFMALTLHDPDARGRLLSKAHAFTGFKTTRDEHAMPSDLYYPALTVAVQDSDTGFLTHLIAFRSELDDPLFERASANAIGRVGNPALLGAVHDFALDEKTGTREAFGVIDRALSEPALSGQHWIWFRENFAAIVDRLPAQNRRFTPGMADTFCDREKLGELHRLFDEYGDLVPGYQRSLSQTEERIGLCIALRDRGKKLAAAINDL